MSAYKKIWREPWAFFAHARKKDNIKRRTINWKQFLVLRLILSQKDNSVIDPSGSK